MEKILCVYVTRQVDSNLMMASTVFRGLYEAGYEADMVFMGSTDAVNEFNYRYKKYFRNAICRAICPSLRDNWLFRKKPIIYSFLRHFVLDAIKLPSTRWLKYKLDKSYDRILAFVPPYISGDYAYKIKTKFNFKAPLIQYWSDPLSLGNCQEIDDIPSSRFMHRILERRLIKEAAKIVFFYPLLCEMESKLYPEYKDKLTWVNISYIKRIITPLPQNSPIKIGLFGAFPSSVRNLKPLIEVVSKIPEINLIIRGDGDIPFDISGVKNVDVKVGRLPSNEIEKLEQDCDILLCLNGFRNIGPAGKIFYYAGYNRPIIVIADGKHAKYFIDYMHPLKERYIVCQNNVLDIHKAIVNAINSLHNFRLKIPQEMEASKIAKKILEI